MAKRSLPSSTEARKVCVVCYGEGIYNVLFMDLDINGAHKNSTYFISIKPAIQFEYPKALRFCESNSCLYVIHASPRLRKSYWGPLAGLPMFKIHLSPHIWDSNSVTKLKPELGEQGLQGVLIPCPHMKTPKKDMDTIKTPDGRILVFSRLIRVFKSQDEYDEYQGEGEGKGKGNDKDKDEDEDEVEDNYGYVEEYEDEDDKGILDFEIYDPKSESWSSLPQLVLLIPNDKSDLSFCLRKDEEWIKDFGTNDPLYGKGTYPLSDDHIPIRGGSFINNNTFHVVVQIGAMFTLNIDNPREGWMRYQGKIELPDDLDDFYEIVQEDLILTADVAKRGIVSHPLSWTMYPYSSMDRQRGTILVLDTFVGEHTQKCVACIVGTGTDYCSLNPYIICDLFSIDLSLETPPEPLATFKYIAKEERFYDFTVYSVFPISATESLEEGQEKRSKITAS